MSQQNHQLDDDAIGNEMKLKLAILETKVQMIESAYGHIVDHQIQEQENAKLEEGMQENPQERKLEDPKMEERTKGRTKLSVAAHMLAPFAKWTGICLCVFLLISILVLQMENIERNETIRRYLMTANNMLKESIEMNDKKLGEFGKEMASIKKQIKEGTTINFNQVKLAMSKQVNNPEQNIWNATKTKATISTNGLEAGDNTNEWVNVYAVKGFYISGQHSRKNNFPGTIVYYYEVTQIKMDYAFYERIYVGLSNGNISDGSLVGNSPNSYAAPLFFAYNYVLLSGKEGAFEWPNGAAKPTWNNFRDVLGCGLLLSPENELSIFFTFNGILLGKQITISPTVDFLIPTVSIRDISVQANFGDDQQARPFKYDIEKCPGLDFL